MVTLVLAVALADQTERTPQLQKSDLDQKQHKRQHDPSPQALPPQYTPEHIQPPQPTHLPPSEQQQYVMKEVIMYLTPTQIRQLKAGQDISQVVPQAQLQQYAQQPHPQQVQQVQKEQNVLQEVNQLLKQQYEQNEANRNRQHLEDAAAQQLLKTKNNQQPPTFEKHPQPAFLPHLQFLPQQPQGGRPGNFDYVYLFPQGNPKNQQQPQQLEKQQQAQPHFQLPEAAQQLLLLQQQNPQLNQQQNFQLVPYEYGAHNEAEAQKLLIKNLENPLQAQRLNIQQLESQNLGAHLQQLIQKNILQAQEIKHQQQLQQGVQQLYPHQLSAENNRNIEEPHHFSTPEELEAAQQFVAQKIKEHKAEIAKHIQEEQSRALLVQQLEEIHEIQTISKGLQPHVQAQEQNEQLAQQQHINQEANNIQEALKQFEEANKSELSQQNPPFNPSEQIDMKEIIEAHKLKAQIQAEEKEAERLDAQLKAEEHKVEDLKEEQQKLQVIREFQAKKHDMHSILTPLVQHQNILDSLNEQKNYHFTEPKFERGFVPLVYAPKYNSEKYAKEVQKMLLKNKLELEKAIKLDQEKALAEVAAIANEPPVVVKKEVIKHVQVPVPAPYIVRVPEPFEVKVPQPYAVPLEIIRHIPYPVIKMEPVEVEKPVPYEVEKHVPYPVEKKVYIKVDKPYYVRRIVPKEIKKEIPVPLRKNGQKISIIKHVWN